MHNYIKLKKEIENFLEEFKKLLTDKKLKLDIINSRKNMETLLDLNFNLEDVKIELLKLKVEEYVESMIDIKDGKELNVFSQIINNRQLYIKVKVRSKENKTIVCLSFHYAKHTINVFPYK